MMNSFSYEQLLHNFLWALLINGIIAALGYYKKAVSTSGIFGGLLVGIIIYTILGIPGFMILFLFFTLGTLATKWGYSRKKAMGLAEKNEGKRGFSNVIGKCGAGTLFAICMLPFMKNPSATDTFDYPIASMLAMMFSGSFAAGTFDTISSEIGQLYGKTCYTLMPFKKVPRGTEGAMSLEGTLAGIIGTIPIAFFSAVIFFDNLMNVDASIVLVDIPLIIIAGAFASNVVESLLGTFLEAKGKIGKTGSNLINTFLGGVFSLVFAMLFFIIRRALFN
jgi:uncharacterized protein (TIGR00297 family)